MRLPFVITRYTHDLPLLLVVVRLLRTTTHLHLTHSHFTFTFAAFPLPVVWELGATGFTFLFTFVHTLPRLFTFTVDSVIRIVRFPVAHTVSFLPCTHLPTLAVTFLHVLTRLFCIRYVTFTVVDRIPFLILDCCSNTRSHTLFNSLLRFTI